MVYWSVLEWVWSLMGVWVVKASVCVCTMGEVDCCCVSVVMLWR